MFMNEDLEAIKERYKDEWILVEILEEEENGTPKTVKLISHSKNRDETYEALREHKDRRLYHFYNGEIPQEGYAVAFHALERAMKNYGQQLAIMNYELKLGTTIRNGSS